MSRVRNAVGASLTTTFAVMFFGMFLYPISPSVSYATVGLSLVAGLIVLYGYEPVRRFGTEE